MAFLKRILGEPKPQPQELRDVVPDPSLVIDPTLGDPDSTTWLRRVAAGEDLEFREYLRGETDLEHRDFVIDAILESTQGRAEWVDRWVADEPESALAQLVLGRHITLWAWEARSHLRAAQVSEEQFNQFFARLDLGWRAFERAIALDPEEASTYSMSIDCAKGLQSGHQVQWELYAAAQSRRPWQLLAHTSLLQAWAPKWSHDVGMMFRFARDITVEGAARLGRPRRHPGRPRRGLAGGSARLLAAAWHPGRDHRGRREVDRRAGVWRDTVDAAHPERIRLLLLAARRA